MFGAARPPLANHLHRSRVLERRLPSRRMGLRVWPLPICRRSVERLAGVFERPTHVISKHPAPCDPDTRKAAKAVRAPVGGR